MDGVVENLNCFLVLVVTAIMVEAVPPEACFANFRWDDCGSPPTPVMYYWKPGSRCEVGIWRGCLPNHNMFRDEYECINTCVFVARAQAEDYHGHLNFIDEYAEDTENTNVNDTIVANSNEVADGTTAANESVVTTVNTENVNVENDAEVTKVDADGTEVGGDEATEPTTSTIAGGEPETTQVES